ncbi:ATP-binding protein [Antarctobacter jejuensis]|uniref:ATP-binding protein n=1 Tax=Antarctobacter jejuensis TaxID=1439938 RepID=UPI003FD20361
MNLLLPEQTQQYSLSELGLVDAPTEGAFDNLIYLASDLLGSPVSLVSIVDWERDRQFFKAHLGLPPAWAAKRQSPLSHSFCQHVVAADAPLIVDDATSHPIVSTNKAIDDLNVHAYLGVPIHNPARKPVGALCVIEPRARVWTQADLKKLERLAACVDDLIRLRASLMTSDALRREQEEFTFAISHDLKSPTNTMFLLQSELLELLGENTDVNIREILTYMDATNKRMGQLVDGVLSYTQLVGQTVPPDAVALSPVLQGVVGDFRGEITTHSAHIELGELPSVMGNALQLRILFQNLVGNALKFRAIGRSPEVQIRWEAGAPDGFERVCVEDNGIGIAEASQEKVFKLFQRLNLAEDYPGTGLGLALCKRIVGLHNGKIDVHSQEGTGTTFVVTLPAVG